MKHELVSTEDLVFILDEALHSFKQENKLSSLGKNSYAKLFIAVTKTSKAQGLLSQFDHSKVKYLGACCYDIFVMLDCDSSVLF